MRIIVASDSFKGSLSSSDIIRIVRCGVRDLLPGAHVVGIPMADGGEGTVEALVGAMGGALRTSRVIGPLGSAVDATWGLLAGGTAIIEMAAASGLPLVPEELRDPLHTGTWGTGELMRAALDAGATAILLSIGGSATNDGGMGMLSALGACFYDADGNTLVGTGADLSRVVRVDCSTLDRRLGDGAVSLRVMCDVDSPLLGSHGAAMSFAPQKGAGSEEVVVLEEGMASYARVVADACGIDFEAAVTRPGAGAAGGLGFALASVLGATTLPGIEVVLDAVGFDDLLADTDLVITGEGRLDAQTAHGKVIAGIARRCHRAGVPCHAIVGSIERTEDVAALGLSGATATAPAGMPLTEAMSRAEELYAATSRRVLWQWAEATGSRVDGRCAPVDWEP